MCSIALSFLACAGDRDVPGALATGGSTWTADGGGPALSAGGSGVGGGQGTGGEEVGSGGGSVSSSGGSWAAGGHTGTGGAVATRPAVEKAGETLVARDGLRVESYGGYLNGESFQQDGILSYGDVQYVGYWNQARHVVLAARKWGESAWQHLELSTYENQADDAHNTISMGVSPADARLHLAFDHHDSPLHYRKSVAGLLDRDFSTWSADDFGAVSDALVAGEAIEQVTYPRFASASDGETMLLSVRIGQSGLGTLRLWQYTAQTDNWQLLGNYLDGSVVDENPYLHGLSYGATSSGSPGLHLCWCNRATPDATTNHDLHYMYSLDGGKTFLDNAGQALSAAGPDAVHSTDERSRVWPIAQNRGLINQEHMVVDAAGRVHVLLSHLTDDSPADSDFTRARTKSEFFHYYRATDGQWHRTSLGAQVVLNFRGKLAVAPSGNVYAVLPDLRIWGASPQAEYTDWEPLFSDAGRFFSDPLIDASHLTAEGTLSVFYPLKNSGDIAVLDFILK